jgi:hypothetical protein
MTGAGHKDSASVARLAADNRAKTIDVDELVGVMESFAIGRQRA